MEREADNLADSGRNRRTVYFVARGTTPEDAHVGVDSPEDTLVQFYPKETFDEIDRIVCQSDITIEVDLNIKCWHWNGPIADRQIYISTDNREKNSAELAAISVNRSVPIYSVEENGCDSIQEENDYARPMSTANFTHQQLFHMEKQIDSMKPAVWVAALAASAIAVAMIL